MRTTNYLTTFIAVAEDCPVQTAEIPPRKSLRTVAAMQYAIVSDSPYTYTSDDVIFHVFAERNEISENKRASERKKFFSRGQPCLRSSPLSKRYGWGIHSDANGKVALCAMESARYRQLAIDENIKQLTALRSSRR